MEKSTKKFVMWLIICNVILIIAILTLGFIFIKSSHNARFYKLGQGMGQFLAFANLAAVLIRYLIIKKRKNK